MGKFVVYLKYLILGVVQGVAELLPISSSGHIALFQELFKIEDPGLTFEMFTNMASLIALILIFHKDIWALIKGFFLFIFKKEDRQIHQDNFLYSLKLVVAVIPIGILGFLLRKHLPEIKSLLTIGIGLFITGSFLLIIYLRRNKYESHDEVTWKDACFIGFFQTFALAPGISRSGSTFAGGRASRLSLRSIIKFSFLCYIIISIPTSFLGFYDLSQSGEAINWLGYSLAFVATFIFTFITAKLVLEKLKLDHFIYFSIYCLIISSLAITLYFL